MSHTLNIKDGGLRAGPSPKVTVSAGDTMVTHRALTASGLSPEQQVLPNELPWQQNLLPGLQWGIALHSRFHPTSPTPAFFSQATITSQPWVCRSSLLSSCCSHLSHSSLTLLTFTHPFLSFDRNACSLHLLFSKSLLPHLPCPAVHRTGCPDCVLRNPQYILSHFPFTAIF